MLNVNSTLNLIVIVCVFEKWVTLNSVAFYNLIVRKLLFSMLLCVIS